MMQEYSDNSYLFAGNAPYVEELYEAYLDNPANVPENWRAYFNSMQNVPAVDGSNRSDIRHGRSSPRMRNGRNIPRSRSLFPKATPSWTASASPRSR